MTDPRTGLLTAGFWFGDIERGRTIIAAHPELSRGDIHVAALLGDDAEVRTLLAADPSLVRARSGPRQVDPLTCLCFSEFLRAAAHDAERSDAFVRAAAALLDAGADVAAGFHDETHSPPEWESLIYGAAGFAFSPELTRLLLDRGADPNDVETPYHAAETYDNRTLGVLLESGKLHADNLNTLLLRKADWHDLAGVRLLLEHGASPNAITQWGRTAFHQAVMRDNDIAIIDLMLDHGADPTIRARPSRHDPSAAPRSPVEIAARRGRSDVLRSLARRGLSVELSGVDALIAACALDDGARVDRIAAREPAVVEALRREGAIVLAEFAGTGNAAGVSRLLGLGVPVDARYPGDGYFAIAPESTALHVAAWRAWTPVIELLLARGADANARNARGETPLVLAVRAATDSYWTGRRTPDGVRTLLAAGASTDGVRLPTGYDAIDTLLARPAG